MKCNLLAVLVLGSLLCGCSIKPVTQPIETTPKPCDTVSTEIGYDSKRCTDSWCTVKVSYYGFRDGLAGHLTANGERFNPSAMTVAHKTLKFGTKVRFRNPNNGREVILRVNDRGPHIDGREFDLSYGAAQKLDIIRAGVGILQAREVANP